MSQSYKEYLIEKFGKIEGYKIFAGLEKEYKQEVREALAEMGVSERHIDCSFENYACNNAAQEKIVDLLITKKDWFLFLGKSGTGKNHLATAMLRKYFYETKKTNAGIFKAKNLMDRLYALSFSEKEIFLNRLAGLDLLIINEIGRTNTKEFFRDTLFDLLDQRFDNFKQTVLIGNISQSELLTMFMRDANDDAMQRRLSHATQINFDWEAFNA